MSAFELKGWLVVRSIGFFVVAPAMSLTSSESRRPGIECSSFAVYQRM